MVKETTLVSFSDNESDLLNLRIGRCNAGLVESDRLMRQLVGGRYDLCRLRLPCTDETINERLDLLGMPYYFSGSIRRYKTPIKEKPAGKYIHTDLSFEFFDGSQDRLLYDMIDGTWGDYPIGYYRTPYLNSLVSKKQETECLFRFYREANHPGLNPENNMAFIRHGDNYVGFFALNHIDGHLESHIGGILKPWRNDGYFLDMQRYIKNYCIDHDLGEFWFGARNENSRVQTIFQMEGYLPVGTENVYHVLPLLNHGHQLIPQPVTATDRQELVDHLQNLAAPAVKSLVSDGAAVTGYNWHIDSLPGPNGALLSLGQPVYQKKQVLLAILILDRDLETRSLGHGYVHLELQP